MAYISLPKILWLLFSITTLAATQQYDLSPDDLALRFPYICTDPAYLIRIYPACCYGNPPCRDPRCPGTGAYLIRATNATKVSGAVDVLLGKDKVVPIQGVADVNTRRNYITSKLVNALGLAKDVKKLDSIDTHPVEIFGRNVTIKTFVPLSIRSGIDGRILRNRVFEIIPDQRSLDKELAIPNLVLSQTFLQEAGALAVNQAIFTTNDCE